MYLVGSYSEGNDRNSIYKVELNNNKLELLGRVESGYNPSFIINDGNNIVFLNEIEDEKNLRILNNINGTATEFSSGGVGPCHINKFKNYIAISNYTSGSISLLKKVGESYEFVDHVMFQGSGPNKERQESSHVHSSIYNAVNNLLYCVDLGCDVVTVFKVSNDKLEKVNEFKSSPGDGPRMMAINGEYGYIVNELSNTVSFVKLGSNGEITLIDRSSTLPDGCNKSSLASHIVINNNRLFISNRGYDSLVQFDITKNKPEDPKWLMLKGDFPRHFIIENNYILIANQESNSLELYSLNNLEFLDSVVIYKPTVVVSLPLTV